MQGQGVRCVLPRLPCFSPRMCVFPSCLLSSPFLLLLPDLGSYSKLFSPLPTTALQQYGTCLLPLSREGAVFPFVVDSLRFVPTQARIGALGSWCHLRKTFIRRLYGTYSGARNDHGAWPTGLVGPQCVRGVLCFCAQHVLGFVPDTW